MSKRKGRRNERAIDEAYQRAGYWTYRPENASYGDNDMWNWFDVAAVFDDAARNAQMIFTQVKSNGTGGELRDFFAATTPFQALRDVTVHFVVVYDGHGGPHAEPAAARVAVPDDDGPVGSCSWVVDEREMDTDALGDGLVEFLRGDRR